MGVPEVNIGVFEWKMYKESDKSMVAHGFIVSVGAEADLARYNGRLTHGYEYWSINDRVEIGSPHQFWVKLVDVVGPGETNGIVDRLVGRLGDPEYRGIVVPVVPVGLQVAAPPDAPMVWCRAQEGISDERCTSPKEGAQRIVRRGTLHFPIAATAAQQIEPTWYWWQGQNPDLFGAGQAASEGDELVFDTSKETTGAQPPWRCAGPLPSDPSQKCDANQVPLTQ
jgi:hypothetical protein